MVSVIVPVLNDSACLRLLLQRLEQEPGELDVIVVDGGSTDGLEKVTEGLPRVRLLPSPGGRGRQMNEGAHAARCDTLLFLHSDTLPPLGAIVELPELLAAGAAHYGAFRVRFDPPYLLPQLLARFTYLAKPWTCFGDQGIFVRRDFFDATGGFPEIPVLEEVHWLRTAGRLGKMIRSPHTVVTSARRFEKTGQVRQTLRNGWILLRDRMGEDPTRLAKLYRSDCAKGS